MTPPTALAPTSPLSVDTGSHSSKRQCTVMTLHGSSWRRDVDWSDSSCLASASFWTEQARQSPTPKSLRMGETLAEEVALCLLGGYGVNEAMSTSAFRLLRTKGLLSTSAPASKEELEAVLRTPMTVPGYKKPVRYRFPSQRAERISSAIRTLTEASDQIPSQPRDLRNFLMSIKGIGPKTASWIVRNLTMSDDVAIIDIHIRRAGIVAGVFDPHWRLPRDYLIFEEAFCAWARAGNIQTAALDLYIWETLANLGTTARLLFDVRHLSDLD